MGKIIESIVKEYKQLPSSKDLTLTADIDPKLALVCGDNVSLSMLVDNLVGNAVKYNKPGGRVQVRASGNNRWIKIEVSDTGLGIPESFRAHLFEEFSRVKVPETQNIPGTGLGLVICKKIVDELGGSIEVDSKEGEYTTFAVNLPAAKPEADVDSADAIGRQHT